jgi:hypothetical protein
MDKHPQAMQGKEILRGKGEGNTLAVFAEGEGESWS